MSIPTPPPMPYFLNHKSHLSPNLDHNRAWQKTGTNIFDQMQNRYPPIQPLPDFGEIRKEIAYHGYELKKFMGGGMFGHAFMVQYNGGWFDGAVPRRQIQPGGVEEGWGLPSALPLQPGYLDHPDYVSLSPGKRALLKLIAVKSDRDRINKEQEIHTLVALRHPHVTRVFDAFIVRGRHLAIVMELGQFGSLLDFKLKVENYLAGKYDLIEFNWRAPFVVNTDPDEFGWDFEKNSGMALRLWRNRNDRRLRHEWESAFYRKIDFRQSVHWCAQIALAMHYINHRGYFHIDLHPRNTFLFEAMDPFGIALKIGDFGNTRRFTVNVSPDRDGVQSDQLKPNFNCIKDVTVLTAEAQLKFDVIDSYLMPNVSVRYLLDNAFNFTLEEQELNKQGLLVNRLVEGDVFDWGDARLDM